MLDALWDGKMAEMWKKRQRWSSFLNIDMSGTREATHIFLILLHLTYGMSTGGTVPVDIVLSPTGDIETLQGSTVIVNCSRMGVARPSIRWRLPWNHIKLSSEHPVTKGGATRGRFSNVWTEGHSILQLVIAQVRYDDSGTYTCEYDDDVERPVRMSKSVRIIVLNQANASNCNSFQFRCPGTEICIPLRFRCDHTPDCPDQADELNCPYDSCRGKFKCRNGQCIEARKRCDGWQLFHCRDHSDEENCPNRITYTGQVKPKASDSASMQSVDSHPSHSSWHFNAIYSGVAAVVGLVCVVAVVVVTVCRIHMRREALRQMLSNGQDQQGRRRRRHHRQNSRPAWQQSTPPQYEPTNMEDYIPPSRCPANTNLAVSINVQFTPNRTPEFTNLVVTPPPYKEVEEPSEGTPPPPYSTLDRPGGGASGGGASGGTREGAAHQAGRGAGESAIHEADCALLPPSSDCPSPSPRDLETGQAHPGRSPANRELSDSSSEQQHLLETAASAGHSQTMQSTL